MCLSNILGISEFHWYQMHREPLMTNEYHEYDDGEYCDDKYDGGDDDKYDDDEYYN